MRKMILKTMPAMVTLACIKKLYKKTIRDKDIRIMIERYSRKEMSMIWDIKNKYDKWLQIEILVCEAQARLGNIPDNALGYIKKNARFDIGRIDELEKVVKHDVIAFLTNVSEYVGEYSRFIHLGLTSSDILDTGLAIQMREASDIILGDLKGLADVLKEKAHCYKDFLMIGRSHGIHAEPITFGLKLAMWYEETKRNIERMKRAKEVIRCGQISGPVGTFSNIDPYIEEYVCEKCGLIPARISSQIIQRDRHSEYLSMLAIIASSIDKITTEIRLLQHTEVLEAEENFSKGQKGSSAMPHKRNPIVSEQMSGLARILRSNSIAAMENIALWHERDISHSSVERIIIPDSAILIDYMLNKTIGLIKNLSVYPENMKKNLEKTNGLIFSQRILLELAKGGATREDAYSAVQKEAMKVWKDGGNFIDLILQNKYIMSHIKPDTVKESFDLKYYTRNVDTIFKRVFD